MCSSFSFQFSLFVIFRPYSSAFGGGALAIPRMRRQKRPREEVEAEKAQKTERKLERQLEKEVKALTKEQNAEKNATANPAKPKIPRRGSTSGGSLPASCSTASAEQAC